MKEESAPNLTRHTFSANHGNRNWFLLGTFACVLAGVGLLVRLTISPYMFVFVGAIYLRYALWLGKLARDRSGRIEIFEDRIEASRLKVHAVVLFNGTETVVPLVGGFALCQGTSRIPIYRRHPKFAQLEHLLLERSRVFGDARCPAVPFGIAVPPTPDYSMFYVRFGIFWLILILCIGFDTGRHEPVIALLLLAFCSLVFIPRKYTGRTCYTFKDDRVVITCDEGEHCLHPRDLGFMIYDGRSLSINTWKGKVFTLRQHDVVMPLKDLEALLERSYGLGTGGAEGRTETAKYAMRQSGSR